MSGNQSPKIEIPMSAPEKEGEAEKLGDAPPPAEGGDSMEGVESSTNPLEGDTLVGDVSMDVEKTGESLAATSKQGEASTLTEKDSEAEKQKDEDKDGVNKMEKPKAGEKDQKAEGSDDKQSDSTKELEKAGDKGAEVEAESEPAPEPKKLGYIDFLSSPIVSIHVGTSPTITTLTCHLLLLQRSPFFSTRTSALPSNALSVTLPDDDLSAVGSFLEFLYVGEYTPRLIQSGPDPRTRILEGYGDDWLDQSGELLLQHARVYTLAEKLGMGELKTLAHSKIHRINSTAAGELRYARFVYANTPKEDTTIRQPIASFWAARSHVLRHEAEEDFRKMILEYPQFAYDILTIVLDQKEKHSQKRQTIEGGGPASRRGGAVAPAAITQGAHHTDDSDVVMPPPPQRAAPAERGPRGRKRIRTSSASVGPSAD